MDERCSIALSVRRGHWPPKYPRDGVGLFGRDGPVTELIKTIAKCE